jgi:choline dehydrogenase-like flavoprotein
MIADIYDTAGIPKNLDGNDGDPLGYFEFASNTFEGERQWSADCYPRGENVTLWTEKAVSKVIIENGKAVGVEVLGDEGERKKVRAGKEVLVCAGAEASPKILLLRYACSVLDQYNPRLTIRSGIGPKSEPQKHGIPQVVDLPVGENFSDHPFLATFWKARDCGLSLDDMEMVTPD